MLLKNLYHLSKGQKLVNPKLSQDLINRKNQMKNHSCKVISAMKMLKILVRI